MSAPLFLVDPLPMAGIVTVDGPEGRHAAVVQRLRAGERLLLGDGHGSTASAVVTAVGPTGLTATIENHWYVEPPTPRLVVAQGIPKGDRGELAVQAMTEVGVDEIVPWAASRCVTVWRGARGTKARDKWVVTAREATKQARRSWLPVITDEAVSTATLVGRAGTVLVLHEGAETPLSGVALPSHGDILVVIGPEGGIADAEITALAGAGAVPVRLGSTVLRTSTAGVAALSVLAARLGRW